MPLLEGSMARQGISTRRVILTQLDRSGFADLIGLRAPNPFDGPGLFAAAAETRPELTAMSTSIAAWSAVAHPRRILLAGPRSFCAGVERAIDVVERVLEKRGSPVYVRKQIVHNTAVVDDLAERGAVFVEELDEVPAGATVVFSAHGVAPEVHSQARERELDVIDATCPLVSKVHHEARRFAARGDTIVLIGHRGHEEVVGTRGEAPEHTVVVESVDEVATLEVPDPRRISYLMQTTLAVDEAQQIVRALRARFPAARGPNSDDICYATTNRQDALHAVCADADLVLVVGSANSSNSVRLVELAHRLGVAAERIDTPQEIRPEWLADRHTIGLTAGASAPPRLVDEVISALGGLGPVSTHERRVATETIDFALPKKAR